MSLVETLEAICALQPNYSPTLTAAMRERGNLIRTTLRDHIEELVPVLQEAFPADLNEIKVGASDGIGRKTEAPWVRPYSTSMSPNPREGFYFVIHFAADGSAIFITVGCGSTTWRGGSLTAIPDSELHRRTSWARKIILEKWGTLEPFSDEMRLGAKAPLPGSFERATAIAKRIPIDALRQVDISALIYSACQRLAAIYVAQLLGREASPGDEGLLAIAEIASPGRNRGSRQGRGLTGPERLAVEHQAMAIAIAHFKSDGFECKDVSSNESFDLFIRRGHEKFKVEVKGTTSDFCRSILMTKNEVDLHRSEKGNTCLVIVSKIRLDRSGPIPVATGGESEVIRGWDINSWSPEPIAYEVLRPD